MEPGIQLLEDAASVTAEIKPELEGLTMTELEDLTMTEQDNMEQEETTLVCKSDT
jgi:hypothetical protein